jgi:hypothetical protein
LQGFSNKRPNVYACYTKQISSTTKIYYVSDGIGPLNSYNYSPVYKLDFGGEAPPPPPSLEVLILAVAMIGIKSLIDRDITVLFFKKGGA